MAGPITWRNVGGDGGRQGAQLLRGGQDQLMGAGDSLLRTLDQFRKMNVDNAAIIKAGNTQDYLDQVAGVGDANALANPETQAQLDAARLGYGTNIDRGVARGAVADRLAQLQGSAVKTQQYKDVQEEVQQRPIVEDFAAKVFAGDTAGANQLLADNHLRNEDVLRKQLAGRQDDVTNQGYRAAGEQRAQGAEGRAIQSFNLSQEAGKENLANTREEHSYRSGQRDIATMDAVIKDVADESTTKLGVKQKDNVFATGTSDVNKDTSLLLSKAGLGDGEYDSWNPFATDASSRQNMQKRVTSLLTDGVKLKRGGKEINVPIPPALVEQYLSSTKGSMYARTDPSVGMQTYFDNMFKDNPELAQRAFDGLDAKNEHNALISSLKQKSRELRLSKNPNLSSTLDSIKTLRDKVGSSNVDETTVDELSWPPKNKGVLNLY
jgi:hypothetical protein